MKSHKNTIKIAAAGDVLITRRIPKENSGINPIYNFMKRADVRVANLETTVTDGSCFPSAFSGGTWLTTEKGCLSDLKKYGFDLLALSNNHAMDYSYRGLAMTEACLEQEGFLHNGSGKNLYEASRAAMFETPNGRVGVIDICSTFENAARAGIQTERQPGRPGINALRFHEVYRVSKYHAALLQETAKAIGINSLHEKHREQGFFPSLPENVMEFGPVKLEIVPEGEKEGRFSYPEKTDVDRTIAGIKEALFSCEAVIVMVHSHEIKNCEECEADYFLEEFAHRCIDAGASAVIGSGTHQIKGIEFYQDCPIFYCLGNFIFENEYVRLLPADYMEKYKLPVHESAALGIQTRTAGAKKSLYTIPEVYQSLIPYFEIQNGKCVHLELLPVELGFEKKRHEKNLPYPASEEQAVSMLAYLNHACRPYHVTWNYQDGVFIRKES